MIINEDGEKPANGTGTQPQQGEQPKSDSGITIGTNQSNAAAAKDAPANANNANPQQEVNGELNLINAYKKIGQRLLAAEMKAAGTIYKDYIAIMKVHAPENGNNPVQQAAKDQEKQQQGNNQNTQQQQQSK